MTRGRLRGALVVMAVVAALGAGCTSSAPKGPGPTLDPSGIGDAKSDATSTTEAGSAPGTAALLAAVCAGSATVSDAGTVSAPALAETSGLAASRRNPGVWWVHNDSGDSARFFALSGEAQPLATIEVDGATATDWEDIAVGPPSTSDGSDPATSSAQTLYLADIGDNGRSRSGITVYRLAEPTIDKTTPGATRHVTADALTFTYPDGPHDAEALMVDPRTGDLVIVTKDWTLTGHSQIFRAPAGMAAGSTTVLEQVATLDLLVGTLVTGADVSPDGSVVALRSYTAISLYPRPADQPLWSALRQAPCTGPPPIEKQGEAIAFTADGSAYATLSEGKSPTLHLTRP